LPTIAVSGVWSWRTQDNGVSLPIADLDRIDWNGRTVRIVFDSDATRKSAVQAAEQAFARELAGRGATVFGVRLPDTGGKKVGLDDFLLTAPAAALDQLPSVKLVEPTRALGLSVREFLVAEAPNHERLIIDLLSADGGGWIAGEEKLGKTFYALEEALCLALGLPVCGRFEVPRHVGFYLLKRKTHRGGFAIASKPCLGDTAWRLSTLMSKQNWTRRCDCLSGTGFRLISRT
jgi:hypothetical protein